MSGPSLLIESTDSMILLLCQIFRGNIHGIDSIDHELVTLTLVTYAGLKHSVRWKLVMVINIISTSSVKMQ